MYSRSIATKNLKNATRSLYQSLSSMPLSSSNWSALSEKENAESISIRRVSFHITSSPASRFSLTGSAISAAPSPIFAPPSQVTRVFSTSRIRHKHSVVINIHYKNIIRISSFTSVYKEVCMPQTNGIGAQEHQASGGKTGMYTCSHENGYKNANKHSVTAVNKDS